MKEEEFLYKLGQKIRMLRTKKSLTLYDLEVLTNIDAGDLSRLESGHTNSKIFTLYKISQALGVSINKLLDIENDN